uniref:E2F/DP family winged-helix DNA-binding domain-containing protein n=1 Tax=Lates calcarifer TaxID=8187 RepID=A0A4W6EQ17_LATCA
DVFEKFYLLLSRVQVEVWRVLQRLRRPDVSLGLLTRGFLELLLAAPNGSLDLRQVASSLQTRKRRVYDITNVLDGINLIQKESANRIKGKFPISNFLWKNQQRFQRELENLKLVEDTLDGLIKSCAQQLFDMTDDVENSVYPFTPDRGQRSRDQTAIIVKAPEETKLEIPPPKEDSIQVHLKAGKGPIMVLTCEVGSGDAATSDPGETGGGGFLSMEESRIKTTTLHSGTNCLMNQQLTLKTSAVKSSVFALCCCFRVLRSSHL